MNYHLESLGNLRTLLSLLLVCSPLLLLNGQGVNGQTLTTSTSAQNITMITVFTAYSTVQRTSTTPELIHYQYWPYDYDNLTGTFSLWQMNTWPTVLVGFTYEELPCLYFDYFVFNATAGEEVKGQFMTEQGRPVGFYVLNPVQFQHFGSSGCVIGNWAWEVYEFGPAGDFDWSVPETGRYTFLFLSRSYYGEHIHFTVQAYAPIETTSLSTYMVTSTYTLQSSEILVPTLTSVGIQNSTPENELLLATLVITAMLILAIGFIAKARYKIKPAR